MDKENKKLKKEDLSNSYEFGFQTEIETEFAPKGLNEETIHFISNKKK